MIYYCLGRWTYLYYRRLTTWILVEHIKRKGQVFYQGPE